MKVLVPFPEPATVLGGLPAGLPVGYFDGVGEPPGRLDDVEFYVPAYMGPASAVQVIDRLPGLRVVQTLTAGFDNVVPYLRPGITLCNARGVHDASTAELIVGLILASLRGIPEFVRAQDRGEWLGGPPRRSLADRTVLIVGYGSVGRALAARLAPFECTVRGVARHARDGVAGLAELPGLLGEADVVVLLMPLTQQTRGMVDAAFLARLRDGALLVNAARGPVVDTGALLAELTAGRLSAAVDVTDPEPLPPGHPLWRAPNLLVSPHVGGNSTAFPRRAYALVADQLRRFAAGEPLRNVVTEAS